MSSNKKYWKSVEELNKDNSSMVEALKHKEFVQEIPVDEFLGDKETLETSSTTRRDFLKYVGFSTAAWGTKEGQEPKTEITDHLIIPAPFIAKGDVAFKGSTEVTLESVDKNATIHYKLSTSDYKTYGEPFTISEPTTLSVYSEKDTVKSATLSTEFYKIDPNLSIKLETEYANQYNAGGNDALIDGIKGTKDFKTGTWQGYSDTDLVATVDLGSEKSVNTISVNFLKDQRSWIFYPTEVECLVSQDGENFKSIGNYTFEAIAPSDEVDIKTVEFKQPNSNYRYVKIVARKLGVLPEWHLGYEHDGRSWLFVDEIIIR